MMFNGRFMGFYPSGNVKNTIENGPVEMAIEIVWNLPFNMMIFNSHVKLPESNVAMENYPFISI